MPAQLTPQQIARKLPQADLSQLPTSNPGGGKPWLSGGAVVVGNYAGSSVDWSSIANKPTEFPPSAHTHDDRYYTEGEINATLAGYATLAFTSGAYQPLDSDLTAIAALTTTAIGRGLLTESSTPSGSGALARVTSPTFTTPVLGVATATQISVAGAIRSSDANGILLATDGSYAAGFRIQCLGSNGKARFGNFAGVGFQIDANTADTLTLKNAADSAAGNFNAGQLTLNRPTAASYGVYACGKNASGYVDWELNEGLIAGTYGGSLTLRAGDAANTGYIRVRYDQGYPKLETNQTFTFIGSGFQNRFSNAYIDWQLNSQTYLTLSGGTGGSALLSTVAAGTKGLIVKGVASQTANYIESQDSAGNAGFTVRPSSAGASTVQLAVSGPSGDSNCAIGIASALGGAPNCGFGVGDANTGILTTSSGHSMAWRLRGDTTSGGIISYGGVHVSRQGGDNNSPKGSIWCNTSNVFQFRNYGTSTGSTLDFGRALIASPTDDTTSKLQVNGETKIYALLSNFGLAVVTPTNVGSFASFSAMGPSDSFARIAFGFDNGTPFIGLGTGSGSRDTFAWRGSAGVWNFGTGVNNASGTINAATINASGVVTSGFRSLSANPTTLDIASGLEQLVKNTTNGELRRWANDGGSMKSILYA